jgi:methionyl-tRNA formyltransferase
MSERPTRTVFLGSGSFAVPILEALADMTEVEVVVVVTAPDRPAGRGGRTTAVPVAERASLLGLDLLQPARLRAPDAMAEIAARQPRLGILADYGQIVPQALLDAFPSGLLNVHPSLLPRHRGASPIPAAILAGDRETGVSIIEMDAGLDTGAIVASMRWQLSGTETAPELQARASREGAALLRRTIPAWLSGSIVARAQADMGVTLTRPLRRSDGRLDPDGPAIVLERQVRAFQPWPGSFVETPGGRLIVWRAAAAPAAAGDPRGRLFVTADGELALGTGEGRLILEEVQPAGRRRMTAAAFLRGRPTLG